MGKIEQGTPKINSSGNMGESATKSPPNPQPTSATVTGLIKGLIVGSSSPSALGLGAAR